MRTKKWITIVLIASLFVGYAAATADAVLDFDIAAESALLMEMSTGQVLWSKNADMQTEPASLAKIMTMLLAYEAVDRGIATWDDEVVTSSYAASIGGSTALLAPGETFSLENMLRAIAINSANDATVAVAEHLAASEPAFVDAMNRRARELGMNDTVFVNSDGLPVPPGEQPNLTTAADMALLAHHFISTYPEVLELTSVVQWTFREERPTRPAFVLTNTNRHALRIDGVDGLKTGWTDEAGFNLVATAERDGVRLISVVLRTEDEETRANQTARVLNYGFQNFSWHVALPQGQGVGNIRVADGVREQLPVRAAEDLSVFVHRGDVDEISYRVEMTPELRAPIAVDDVVGHVVATLDGEEIGRVPAIAAADLQRANALTRGWRWLRDALSGGD